ncbi:MAG: L,D-transpeptidase family protein, partial [Alphaproteobacteria bacterium]
MTAQFVVFRGIAIAALSALLLACSPSNGTILPAAQRAPAPAVNWTQPDTETLKAAVMDNRMRAFYEARAWRPAWTAEAADQLRAAVKDLPRHAIDPARLNADFTLEDPAAREIELTRAALAYGDILAKGLVDPTKVFDIFALQRNDLDVDGTLSEALNRRRLAEWLDGLPPQDEEYVALSNAYINLLEQAKTPQPYAIAAGTAIKPGQSDPRIPKIAQALVTGGYLLAPAPDATGQIQFSEIYDPSLVEAVKLFQNRQGINADGVLGAGTIAVMNAGPADRARQIALNLETRRWLKRTPPATRIDVNTAASVLDYFRDGALVDTRRVVNGKRTTPTPNLESSFDDLVVNPPWNVPAGIAAKEILPKGAGYLAANDMYVTAGRVVQRPGPKSALGRVKFNMEDPYAIYLHDTPSKTAFLANERHLSHGCIRVDDAIG